MKNFETQATGLEFPKSKNTRVQMMPFIIDDEKTWTEDIKRYGDIVHECLEWFKIEWELYPDYSKNPCFITIDESNVKATHSHRSPWVHTEWWYQVYNEYIHWWAWSWEREEPFMWGWIGINTRTKNLVRYWWIFLASNLHHSTAVWDENIEDSGELWDCSHLGLKMKDAYKLKAGELLWMHDKTPHASLKVKEDTHRQFLRIVWPQVSHWFRWDNTDNPLMDYIDVRGGLISKDPYLQSLPWGEAYELVKWWYFDEKNKENWKIRITTAWTNTKIIDSSKQEYIASQKEKERIHEIQKAWMRH